MHFQGANFDFNNMHLSAFAVPLQQQPSYVKPVEDSTSGFFRDEAIDASASFIDPAMFSTPQASFDMQQGLALDNTSISAAAWDALTMPPAPMQSLDSLYQPFTSALGKRSWQLDVSDFPPLKRHETMGADSTIYPVAPSLAFSSTSVAPGLPDEAADVCATWFNKYATLPSDKHIDSLSQLTGEAADSIRSWFGQLLKQGMDTRQGDSAYRSQTSQLSLMHDSLWSDQSFNDQLTNDFPQNSPTQLSIQAEGSASPALSHEHTSVLPASTLRGTKKQRCTPTDDRSLLARDDSKIYQCTRMCGKRYGRKCDWKRNEEEGYPCKSWVCSLCISANSENVKPCFRKYHFVQHFRNIHPGVDAEEYDATSTLCSETDFPRKCGFCRHTFVSRQERIDHIAEHFKHGKCMLDWNVESTEAGFGSDHSGDDSDDDSSRGDGGSGNNQSRQQRQARQDGHNHGGGGDGGSSFSGSASDGCLQIRLSQLRAFTDGQLITTEQCAQSAEGTRNKQHSNRALQNLIEKRIYQDQPNAMAGDALAWSISKAKTARPWSLKANADWQDTQQDKSQKDYHENSNLAIAQYRTGRYDRFLLSEGGACLTEPARSMALPSKSHASVSGFLLSAGEKSVKAPAPIPNAKNLGINANAKALAVIPNAKNLGINANAKALAVIPNAKNSDTIANVRSLGVVVNAKDADILVYTKTQSLSENATQKQQGMQQSLHSIPATFRSLRSVRLLGAGGFSTVDEVIHSDTNLRMGRKTLKNRDETACDEMRKEVDVLKQLRHPHVIRFLGAYANGDKMSILVSPVADTTLALWLDRFMHQQPPNFAKTIVGMFGCLASSVRYLHEQRPVIKHMDIKPQNVLIVEGEQAFPHVVLCDFGISSSDENAEYTKPLTHHYIAPEVFKDSNRKQAADIWSLGCVFAEMASVSFRRDNAAWATFRKTFLGHKGKHYWQDVPGLQKKLSGFLKNAATHSEETVVRTLKSMLSAEPADRPNAASLTMIFTPAPCCLEWPNEKAFFPGSQEELGAVEMLVDKDGVDCCTLLHSDSIIPNTTTKDTPADTHTSVFNAKCWLDDCSHTHTACQSHAHSGIEGLPTRLVDLLPGGQACSYVRIVNSDSIPSSLADTNYIALSHTWSDDQAKLSSASLPGMSTELPLHHLSSWLNTAMTTARDLGYRYIWDDSLCVIQDSDADKMHECANMASAFRNASLTMVCENPSDTAVPSTTAIAHNTTAASPRLPPATFATPGFGWDTRAWALQDRLLSRRFLHLGEQMYWECNALKASETFPRGMSPLVWEKVHSRAGQPKGPAIPSKKNTVCGLGGCRMRQRQDSRR